MYYPEEVIEDVRIRNDIVEVASSYIKLERRVDDILPCAPSTVKNRFFLYRTH